MEQQGISYSSMELYLRTGRPVILRGDVQYKYNHNHDPRNGQFTFAPGGKVSGDGTFDPANPFDAAHPRNHSIYVVQRGDSLTRVARRRKGLTVTDLAALNGISRTAGLQIGQRLKLPNQSYLEAGRQARANFMNLSYYMNTHNGQLPSNPTRAPSIEQQLGASVRTERRNEYAFHLDVLNRANAIDATLTLQTERRSKTAQIRAGGSYRLPTDDGGHYIALRFNGPRDEFNHFAQDANFNRGVYRVLEDKWHALARSGKQVRVSIRPKFVGASLRPVEIAVIYTIDGVSRRRVFANAPGGK